ncbi:hypothetical protein R3P38DRAFT_2775788 [Favolaschia claudopus]|uniref:Uncharacterized protein n=1 Tax=Favolaschia claudopus TaxID=2862362 RepID=A0AAW0BST4_9AGAR
MSRENEPPTPVDDMSRDQLLAVRALHIFRQSLTNDLPCSSYAKPSKKQARRANGPIKRRRGLDWPTPPIDPVVGPESVHVALSTPTTKTMQMKTVMGRENEIRKRKGTMMMKRKFGLLHTMLGAIENTSYYEKNRFDNMRTKVQGELRAVLEVLPEELHGDVGKSWLVHTIWCSVLGIYADLIGGRKDDSGKITFHPFDAPALHSDGADRLNVETFLKNKLVMHVAAAVIYGKKKPIKMATNKPCVSGPRCMQQMHNISNSTPGFVACAGALVSPNTLTAG